MSAKPAVSVVMPAYNAERTVTEAVGSLLALDYPGDCVELIVVDNGSTDRTAAILARHTDRIRVIHEPRRGRSRARNAGLCAARHPIVAFLDADCSACPDWLNYLVQPLEDPRTGVAGGKILAARPCNAVEQFGESLHDHGRSIEKYRPPYAITANWASRRSVLLEMGPFDENLRRSEDCDMSFRILQAGYRIVYQDRAIVFQRNRPNLPALFGEGFQGGFHSVAMLRKHRAFLRAHGHCPIYTARYKKLAADLALVLRGRADFHARLETIFAVGKYAGKLCGSIRFGCIDL